MNEYEHINGIHVVQTGQFRDLDRKAQLIIVNDLHFLGFIEMIGVVEVIFIVIVTVILVFIGVIFVRFVIILVLFVVIFEGIGVFSFVVFFFVFFGHWVFLYDGWFGEGSARHGRFIDFIQFGFVDW